MKIMIFTMKIEKNKVIEVKTRTLSKVLDDETFPSEIDF